MDVLWNYLDIFCICLSLYLVLYSIYSITKEKKRIRSLLTVGEKSPSWYTNSILRKHVGLLNDGVLLAAFSIYVALYLKKAASATLVLSAALLMYNCSRLADIVIKETLRKRIVRETGEECSHWLSRSQSHQEIATTIFLAGLGVNQLLYGLVSINVLSFEMYSQTAWLWVILMFVGGIYWLTVYIIQMLQKRKRRGEDMPTDELFLF